MELPSFFEILKKIIIFISPDPNPSAIIMGKDFIFIKLHFFFICIPILLNN